MNISIQKTTEDGTLTGWQGEQARVDPEILNLGHLAQYTCNDSGLEQELLGLFKDQAILQFENIEHANCKDDWVMAVHTLKGSARSIGAKQLADLSADLEKVGYEGAIADKKAVVHSLKFAVARCIVAIETLA